MERADTINYNRNENLAMSTITFPVSDEIHDDMEDDDGKFEQLSLLEPNLKPVNKNWFSI